MDFFAVIYNHLTLQDNSELGEGGLVDQVDQILGGYFQKTNQKHSEMVLSTAKRTFQISKLQNYMSHVNEFCSRHIPHQHLSFAQKSGWQ